MKKRKNQNTLVGTIFLIIGVLAIIGAIIGYMDNEEFKKTAIEISAEIIDIRTHVDSDGDTSYDVFVEFVVDGTIYSGELNYYTASMSIGGEVTICYNPSNPNDFRIADDDSWMIGVFIGVFFAIFGLVFLIAGIKNKKKIDKLINSRYMIQASIISAEPNRYMSNNGRHPYVLSATAIAPYDGLTYTFKSESFWNDLNPIIQMYNIKTVPVYVNPQNYKEYYVDIDYFKQYIGN